MENYESSQSTIVVPAKKCAACGKIDYRINAGELLGWVYIVLIIGFIIYLFTPIKKT